MHERTEKRLQIVLVLVIVISIIVIGVMLSRGIGEINANNASFAETLDAQLDCIEDKTRQNLDVDCTTDVREP